MEKHKCKLCTRSFSNGRALGGHMKAHLAKLPLPKKTTPTQHKLVNATESASSSSFSSEDGRCREVELVTEDKQLVYALRNNPKRSFRIADPEFSFNGVNGGSVVVQDRESETESRRTPTKQRRSKRNRPSSAESTTELEPVSSVSDTSSEEEVAMCLMMLSRDVRLIDNETELRSEKISKIRGKCSCVGCGKVFRSFQALDGHKRVCDVLETGNAGKTFDGDDGKSKIFECPFCYKVFGSGQALGGHKRSHLLLASSSSSTAGNSPPPAGGTGGGAESNNKSDNNLIDLNLPAPPLEEDNYSVVSDS